VAAPAPPLLLYQRRRAGDTNAAGGLRPAAGLTRPVASAQTGGVWRHGLPDGGMVAARLRAWTPARWPLTARLAAAVFCLVAVGGGVITAAAHVVAGDYLTRQADQQLRSYATQLTRRPFTLFPGVRSAPGASGLGSAGSALSVAVLSSGGQKLIIAGLATPPPARGGWLEISEPVSYQAEHIPFVYGADDASFSVTGKTGSGYPGTLVIGLNLAGVDRAVDGLTVLSLRVTCLAALLAAAATAVVARLLLRPRAPTAGAGAAAAPVTARDTAGARVAAHDAARRTAEAIAQTCHQMRRPLSVLAGLAEYHRGRGELADDEAGRLVRQVSDQVDRMAALVDELEAAARDDPRPGGPLAEETEKRWTAGEGHDRLAW
jgi:His Kinase A (phospho-acceptor) domain